MLFATTQSVNAQEMSGRILMEQNGVTAISDVNVDAPRTVTWEMFEGNLWLMSPVTCNLTEGPVTMTFQTMVIHDGKHCGVSIEVISGEGYKARLDALEKIVYSYKGGNSHTAEVYDIKGGIKSFDIQNISKITFYHGDDFPSGIKSISIVDFYVHASADKLQIKAEAAIGQVAIVNIAGTIVKNEYISDNSVAINISDLSTGIYFVRTSLGTKKFVKK